MNCLTVAIWIWFKGKCKGKIAIMLDGNIIPHFAVFKGNWAIHYKAENEKLPYWQMLHFKGKIVKEWIGPNKKCPFV